MALFKRKSPPPPAPPPPPIMPVGSSWAQVPTLSGLGRCSVAGESHYQEALWDTCGRDGLAQPARRFVLAQFIPDPANPYDSNAVAVHMDGRIVGHLPRDVAAKMQGTVLQMAHAGATATCWAEILGGTPDKPSLGVMLHLSNPAEPFDLRRGFLTGDALVTIPKRDRDVEAIASIQLNAHRQGLVTLGIEDGRIVVTYGDRRVGRLSASMSERYADLMREALDAGMPTTCKVIVSGAGDEVDAKLMLIRRKSD